MELIFETRFTMEVSDADTVPQIKQKIQELEGIPIASQTLRFNGAVLADDFNLRHYQIADGSTIHLHLNGKIDAAEGSSPLDQNDDLKQELDKIGHECGILPSPPRSDKSPIQPHPAADNQPPTIIHVQEYPTGRAPFEVICPVPIRVRPSYSHILNFEEYSPRSSSPIIPRPRVSSPRQSRHHTGSEMLVGVRCGHQQSWVVVRAEDPVSVLREMELQWILPVRCEFFHNRRLMDERQSFAFNHVGGGDVIEATTAASIPMMMLSR